MLVCRGCRRFVHAEDRACPFCGETLASAPAPRAGGLVLGVALAACGPSSAVDETGTSSDASSSGGVAVTTTTTGQTTQDVPPNPSVATSSADTLADGGATTTTPADDSSGDGGCAFYGCPTDSGLPIIECDVWAQDCMEGQKCMPWANDGGSAWNAARCSPIAATPGAPGDPCTVQGSTYSGIDDCDETSMCWNVDPDTNTGVCVANCTGSEADPSCLDPANTCVIGYDGTVHACLPPCDPLASSCAEGWACVPLQQSLVCVPDASGDAGGPTDGCDLANGCDPGLWCAAPEYVPGCTDLGCCTVFCDLDQLDPDSQCTEVGDGVTCVPWFDGDPLPGVGANLGTCRLPP